ncbi:MAG: PAS domain S-box protein [Proteobacteria bacterium]|nr:PAS domain S-box protein [Pseudomonadota bacterium]
MNWFPFPLRYSAPVILVLLAVVLNLFSFQYELQRSYQRHEDYSKQEAMVAGNTYATLLTRLYQAGHVEIARILIEQIKGDPDLQLALVVDDRNMLLHATSLESARKNLSRIMPQLDEVRAANACKVEFIRNHRTLILFYPVVLERPQGAAAPRTGILHLEYDLAGIKKKAYADAMHRMWGMAMMWGTATIIIWGYFHFAVTSRVKKLLAAVTGFARGSQTFSSGLRGSDELIEISRALEAGIAERTRIIEQTGESLRHEIDERKEIEEALRSSEERFRTLTMLSPVGIYVTDAAGSCTYVNQRWCEMSGLTPEEARGDGWIKALHEDDREEIRVAWERMVRTGGLWGKGYRFITPAGKITWVYGNAAPLPDSSGNIIGFIGTNTDITQLTEAHDALEQERQRLFSLLDELPAYVYVRTADYKIIFTNKLFRQQFGEPGSAHCYELIYHESEPCKECRQLQVSPIAEITQRDVIAFNKNSYQLFEYPFTDIDGRQHILHMGIDITERKTAEQALQESELKLRFLSSRLLSLQEQERKRLAAELHDSISQTLSAAKFGLESIVQQESYDPQGSSSRTMAASVEMLKHAIDEVRKISTDLRPSIIDDLGIVAAIGWFCREFQILYAPIAIEQDVAVKEDDVPAPLKIVIFRVLQEAMNNCVRHSSADRIRVAFKKTAGTLTLKIRDNGTGFAREKPLRKDSQKGGLGLISMKERVELAGGTFSVESGADSGTAVIASWPEAPTG